MSLTREVMRYGIGTVAETREGENVSWILVLVLEECKSLINPHRATAPSSVFSTPPGKGSHIAASPAASGLDVGNKSKKKS